MPNLRNNQLTVYKTNPPQTRVRVRATQPLTITQGRSGARDSSDSSYTQTLNQRAIEYPVQTQSVNLNKALQIVQAAANQLSKHIPNPFAGKQFKPVVPRNSYTANLKVEPSFVYKRTGAPAPTQGPIIELNDRKYIKTPAGPAEIVQLPDNKSNSRGSYVMSKTGRNALSNVFRGTNSTSTRNAPAAISRRMNVVNKPRMTASRRGIVVTHREYMSNILSSATTLSYNAIGLTLNPGKISSFPWLSTIAGNFDKYRILKCTISLVTNQPTTTAGRVGVGFDYDSTDPIPADRTDFFSLTHHSECAAWDSLDFTIPLQGGERFVNSHTATDSKLIDYGQVIIMADQIVTTGTAVNLGDVIISYSVELIDPQQAIMLTYLLTGANSASFDRITQTGPVIGELVPTTSATVVQHKLSIGYYMVHVMCNDFAATSPVVTPNHTTGTTGKLSAVGTTTQNVLLEYIHVLQDEALIQLTLSGVTIANLEGFAYGITRVSPSVYQAAVATNWGANITATL